MSPTTTSREQTAVNISRSNTPTGRSRVFCESAACSVACNKAAVHPQTSRQRTHIHTPVVVQPGDRYAETGDCRNREMRLSAYRSTLAIYTRRQDTGAHSSSAPTPRRKFAGQQLNIMLNYIGRHTTNLAVSLFFWVQLWARHRFTRAMCNCLPVDVFAGRRAREKAESLAQGEQTK